MVNKTKKGNVKKPLSSKQINGIIWGIAIPLILGGAAIGIYFSVKSGTDHESDFPHEIVDSCASILKDQDCTRYATSSCTECENDPNPDFEGNYRCRCPAAPSSSSSDVFNCNTANCFGQNCPEELKADPYYQGCSWVTPGPDMNCTDYYQRGADDGRAPLPDAYCKQNSTTQKCATDYDRLCDALPSSTAPALDPVYDCDGKTQFESCGDWNSSEAASKLGVAEQKDGCERLCVGGKKCLYSAVEVCYDGVESCDTVVQPEC